MKANRMEINKALAAQAAGAFLLATLLPAPIASQGDSATVQVVRVIDGDTIEVCCVFGDRVKVRYIGIDTPETHHPMKGIERYGKEAAEANRKLVDGKPSGWSSMCSSWTGMTAHWLMFTWRTGRL